MRTYLGLFAILAAGAAAGCGPFSGGAGGAGGVAGRVLEAPGDRPLEGVRVTLVCTKSEGAVAVTDRDGRFVVEKPPAEADPLAIRVEKDGYVRGYKPLAAAGGAPGGAEETGPHTLYLLRETPRALIAALKHPDADVRSDAARALGQLPWRQTIDALREALKDESGLVRHAAREALGQLERPAP